MKIYLSHKISGGNSKTSYTEMEKNCKEAVAVAEYIRKNITPSIEIYVPGEQTEQFVRVALKLGHLTVQQVLEIDCGIIDNCTGVLFYTPTGDDPQGGCLIEYEHTIKVGKPFCVFYTAEQAVDYLSSYLLRI